MPQFGVTDRVGLNVIAETTWGVTPNTPAFQALRFTGESLNYSATFVASEEIRADRMQVDTTKVSQQGSGDINAELTFGTFDTLLTGAFMSDWVTTGTPVTATTITLTKTNGTPNTWSIGGTGLNVLGAPGQWIRVVRGALTFYARMLTVAPTVVTIAPLTDVASFVTGTSVTITPANYIRNGVVKKSFTLQKTFNDLAAPGFFNFTGAKIGTWNLELATGALVKTSFSVMSKDAVLTAAQNSGATITPANLNPSMNAVDNVLGVVFANDPGGQAYYFNTLKLTLDNQLRAQMAIGVVGLVGIEAGKLKTTGSIEIYFENTTIYDRFRASSKMAIDFLIQDTLGNSYIVTLPSVKFTKCEIVAGGQNQDIFAKCDFENLIDSSGTYQIQLSRL